MAVFSGL